ncbi:hypothetical protein MASR2M48_28580 [Spirochaetota bacterium]
MNRNEYLRKLFVSPLGIGIIAVSIVSGLGLGLGVNAGLGIATAAGSFVALGTLVTMTGIGSRAAMRESDRRAWSTAATHLEEARAHRHRLATMRLPDPEIKALLALLATRGSAYLAACESARSRDPLAEEALADGVALADLYIKELDGAATERRYGLADADPFVEARSRTSAALLDKAAIIEKATLALSGGLSSADRMELKESL